MWKAVRENPRAVIYAVLMHLVLLALLVFSLNWTPKVTRPGTTKVIQAELVDSKKLQAIEEKKLAEQRRLEDQKRKLEQEKQRKIEAERKQEQKRKAEADRKKKADLAKKKEAEKKHKLEEKRKAEQKHKAEAERKKKAEAKVEAARRKEAEQALQAQVAEEQAEARAVDALSQYIPYIQEKIQRSWLRPPGSPAGLSCLILVKLIPGGEVVSAKVIRSSGDPLFDRSVETAVLKASPLPLPDDAAMFKYFREINFKFNPD